MSKRLLSMLLCALLIGALYAPAMAEEAAPMTGVMLPAKGVLGSNARLREEATTDSATKMILRKGSPVTVLAATGGWLQVQYGNFQGYLRADLIDPASLVTIAEGQGPAIAVEEMPKVPVSDFTLRRGDRGDAVTSLQAMLLMLGYDEVGVPDGAFGAHTQAAVKAFQRDRGLTVDGIVGVKTRAAMETALR
ncbi:MAG: peptidoglycan-binding protein [Oscillospiraceae bacterium]|jgi:hypothetical protein|nr:peptidoglycan-binding protein [Oscillospiraceae bacterium]